MANGSAPKPIFDLLAQIAEAQVRIHLVKVASDSADALVP